MMEMSMSINRMAMAGLLLIVAGCAQSPDETRVVNQSNTPLRVEYREAGQARPAVLVVDAHKSAALGGGLRLADLTSIELRGSERGVIFPESDEDWRNSGCTNDCRIVWHGKGRVDISS